MQSTLKRIGGLAVLCLVVFSIFGLAQKNNLAKAAPITIGETNILSTDDSGNGNILLAQQATLSQTATVQSLSFYVTTAVGNLRLGIYDATGPSGGPGAKRAETNSISVVTGWNTANVITPVSLSAGNYWLAYLPSSSSLAFRIDFNSGSAKWYSFTYGTMPATFSTSPSSSGGVHWSLYANLDSTGGAGDSTPPTVSISSPLGSATVSGSTPVTANASDNVGVAGVQFKVDGNNIGSEDISAPYSISWDTTSISNGAHILTAVARDTSNNTTTSSSISVTASNGVTPPTPPGPTPPPTPPPGGPSPISSARSIDWSQAGVPGGIPNRTTTCSTLNPGATPAQINTAIANCPANQVVFLNAGTYNLNAGLIFNNKRNVTLRGAGANQTFLVFTANHSCGGVGGDICLMNSAPVYYGGPGNIANWTSGYSQGATQITLSSTANLQVGTMINLDQLADSSDDGTIYMASSASSHNCLNCNYAGRPGRVQTQMVRVTSISGNTVSITPGLYLPNWRADRSPGAWWSSDTPISGDGVEDMSIDSNGVKQGGGIVAFYNAFGNWMKGVRTMNAYDSHVKFWESAHNTVRDGYFFANQVAQSQSYGTNTYLAADNLIENNIFQHVTVPNMNETSEGDVYAYNYSINNFFGTNGVESGVALHSAYTHAGGNAYFLWEGNDYDGLSLENFHGPAHFITAFRNRFFGHEQTKSDRTSPIFDQSFQRFTNVVGNVLGDSSYHTNYESKYGDPINQNLCNHSIYALGWSGNCDNWSVPNDCAGYVGCPIPDSRVATTLFRWGNWDTVTNTSRFVSAEVPSGTYGNGVPGSQSLPASLYLSARPSWWPSATPWPPVGPDVSGGNISGLAGHAYKIPARTCFETVMNGTFNDSSARAFNASSCYTSSGVTPPPTPPPTPTPIVSISANPSSITSGNSSTLSWSSTDTTSCTASNAWSGSKSISGTQVVSPSTTSTYALSCSGAGGSANNSATVTVIPAGDTTPPAVSITAPANNATVSGASTAVSATATDAVGVVGVQFKLDGNNLSTEDLSSPYSVTWNTTTASNGAHTLTATARDAAGNNATSSTLTVTVNNVSADTTPPSVPTNLAASAASPTQINLSWTASTDNVGVTGYRVFRNGTQIATPVTTSFQNTGLTASTTYSYTVAAVDAANNVSAQSTSASATTQATPDTAVPTVSLTAPANNATVSGTTNITATANDNVGVVGVQFKRDGINLGSEDTSSPYSFTWDTTGASNGAHTLSATARDAANNTATSSVINVTVNNVVTPPSDTTAPSVPGGLTAATVSSSQINLSWSASTDNTAVAGYKVFRNGSQIATAITSTSYTDSGLATSTSYSYTVSAYDAANNNSSQSTSASATTQAAPSGGGGGGGGGSTPPPSPTPTPTPPGSPVVVRPDHYPSGTIFKYANDATVYIKEGTVARPITDFTVYQNQVPASRTIITIPSTITFPAGPVLGLRSGTLIKASNNPTVYLVVNGKKQAFSTAQEFFDHNYNFSNVYVINDVNLVNSMETTTEPFVRPTGTLFKYSSSAAVYFLNTAKLKRGYTTIEMFNIWNATLKDVVTIPDSEQYGDGPIALFPNGILVKGSSSTVYFVYDGTLRPFTNNALFDAMGLKNDQVKTFSDADISLHPIGAAME